MPIVPHSERIGLLPIPGIEQLLNFLLGLPPGVAMFVMLGISPVGLWVIRLLAGRILRFNDEWRSFLADAGLGIGVAAAVRLVQSLPNRRLDGGWLVASHVFQIVLIVACVIGAVIHVRSERGKYSLRQRWSPTALYHNVVLYLAIGFPAALLGVIGVIFAPWTLESVISRVVFVAAVLLWMRAVKYDDAHQTNRHDLSKHVLAHGENEWWWQGGWCEFPYWWQRLRNPDVS